MEPDAITAWATVGLMLATFVTCFLIWRGIQAMNRSSDSGQRTARRANAQTFAAMTKQWRSMTRPWKLRRSAMTRR